MPCGWPYPTLAPKLLYRSVKAALPATCICPLACEGRPKQAWAAAGALTTAIRAMETTSVRRIRVSVRRVWVSLHDRDRSSAQRLERRLRTHSRRVLKRKRLSRLGQAEVVSRCSASAAGRSLARTAFGTPRFASPPCDGFAFIDAALR